MEPARLRDFGQVISKPAVGGDRLDPVLRHAVGVALARHLAAQIGLDHHAKDAHPHHRAKYHRQKPELHRCPGIAQRSQALPQPNSVNVLHESAA
jgi:hypothetical protein